VKALKSVESITHFALLQLIRNKPVSKYDHCKNNKDHNLIKVIIELLILKISTNLFIVEVAI